MKNYLFGTLIGVCLVGLGVGAYYRPTMQIAVENRTKGIEVVSLMENDQAYELTLKNISNKRINGYSISFKNNASRTVDMSVGEKTIAPGDQFKVTLPHRNDILPPTVRYIVFDDDAGDGDATGILELQDRRSGRAEQLKRILPLLQRAASSPDFDRLKTEIQALPEEAVQGRSVYFVQGQRNAKEDVLLEVDKVDKSNPGNGLTKLADQTRRSLEKVRPKQ